MGAPLLAPDARRHERFSGFLLPVPGIPGDNPPGIGEALWAIPGALVALAASYVYGARREGG